MAEHHRPQSDQEQADGHDDTAVTSSLLQQPRQTAVAGSSSDAGQETQSGPTEAPSNSGGAAAGGITTAATWHEQVPAAAAADLPAAANKQFGNGQALLDGLTAFYKAQGEQAPHITKCATIAAHKTHVIAQMLPYSAHVCALHLVEIQAHETKLRTISPY